MASKPWSLYCWAFFGGTLSSLVALASQLIAGDPFPNITVLLGIAVSGVIGLPAVPLSGAATSRAVILGALGLPGLVQSYNNNSDRMQRAHNQKSAFVGSFIVEAYADDTNGPTSITYESEGSSAKYVEFIFKKMPSQAFLTVGQINGETRTYPIQQSPFEIELLKSDSWYEISGSDIRPRRFNLNGREFSVVFKEDFWSGFKRALGINAPRYTPENPK